ncbi:hypothetical protein [Shouchella tritolerans]
MHPEANTPFLKQHTFYSTDVLSKRRTILRLRTKPYHRQR